MALGSPYGGESPAELRHLGTAVADIDPNCPLHHTSQSGDCIHHQSVLPFCSRPLSPQGLHPAEVFRERRHRSWPGCSFKA
jgi:hypothetical protein